jgi:hypothetical protein
MGVGNGIQGLLGMLLVALVITLTTIIGDVICW